jgi:ABC-type antimicrobial peptide transport system permease subunit
VVEYFVPKITSEPKIEQTGIILNLAEALFIVIILFSYGIKTALIALLWVVAVYVITGLVTSRFKLLKLR